MILGHPLALLLLLPTAGLIWLMRRGGRHLARLPGDWERLVTPALRGVLARSASQGSTPQVAAVFALWLLLVFAIAGPAVEVDDLDDFANIAGRVIAFDLGGGADIHSQRLMAATLLDATPEIPTALVVASGDAFNVVPLTTDRAFLDRYLNVIAPDVMPLEGRALQVTVAQAEGILTLAGVLAGQVVLLSGGEPPVPGAALPPRWSRVVVTDPALRDRWQVFADTLGAGLATYDDLGTATDAFTQRVDELRQASNRAAVHDLTPYLLGVAVLLWLGLFRQRRAR